MLSGLRLMKNSFFKQCRDAKTSRWQSGIVRKKILQFQESKDSPFLTMALGAVASLGAVVGVTNSNLEFSKCRHLFLSVGPAISSLTHSITITRTTQMDYLEHDPKDYDIYIKNPTANDLPYLLNQFEKHGKEVWPWIWTHPNESGMHFVFVGVNVDTLDRIRQLRSKSQSYNILLIATEKAICEAAIEVGDPNIYRDNFCGIVSDASLKLLNFDAKILMLNDERVISFDSLTIV